MNQKKFITFKILISIFVVLTTLIAFSYNNFVLALAGIIIGMLFMFLVRKKTKTIIIDERIELMSGKASKATYGITTMVFAVLSIIFILTGRRTDIIYYQALGFTFSYITLFSIAIYSISYKYYQKFYGGNEK